MSACSVKENVELKIDVLGIQRRIWNSSLALLAEAVASVPGGLRVSPHGCVFGVREGRGSDE
jgi:hypothetical protein